MSIRLTARLLAVWSLLLAPPALAQTGTIRGTVTDVRTRLPLTDVQVGLLGTSLAGVTNARGEYTMANVNPGTHTIRVRRIGYEPVTRSVTLEAGQALTQDFTLGQMATRLAELVVTGTAGEVEKRTIGNAITTVDVADVHARVPVTNVTEVLQARTPGLTLLPGSGTPGAAAEYRIRGASSLTGYAPVIYIDGVRFNNGAIGNFNPTGAGISAQSTQVTNALELIPPGEIESIEVIKGPAAATLYGADAANGVIQIITRKGKLGQQQTRWNARVEAGSQEWALDVHPNYTTCDSVKMAQAANWPGCVGQPLNAILIDDPLKRDPLALRRGDLRRFGLGVSGGTDRFAYVLNLSSDLTEGVLFNSYQKSHGGRANFRFAPTANLDVSVNASFQQSQLRLPISDESGNALTLSGARGRPGAATGTLAPGWRTIDPIRANEYKNVTGTDRLVFGATANWQAASWFRHRFTAGLDYAQSLAEIVSEPRSADTPEGLSVQQVPRWHIWTLDYVGSVIKEVSPAMRSTSSAGIQVIARKDESLRGTGRGLGAPDITTIGNSQTRDALNTYSENNSVGYFVQQEVALKDRLYLTGALRADDNSSFGTDFDLIVYPKLQAAYLLSEEPRFRTGLGSLGIATLKLRAAWGQAGRSPSPFSATRTYTVDNVTLGTATGSGLITSQTGNPGLKPERGSEWEMGFDADVFAGRLGVEFTWWSKRMRDMLVSIPTAPSSGWTASSLTNLGEVQNRGIEAKISGTPVRQRAFEWEAQLNLATYHNRLNSIDGVALRSSISGQPYGVSQEHRVGFPLGAYWVAKPLRNADGSPQLTPAGAIINDTALTFIGPSQPTFEAGLLNTVRFLRNWQVYAVLDYKGGHYLFNQRLRNQCQPANDNCYLTNEPSTRFPQTAQDSVAWRELPVLRNSLFRYVESARFLKLREVSLAYSLPQRWAARLRTSAMTISLGARNLAVWSPYRGSDPEVNSYGGRNFARADTYTVPMLRRWTVAINAGF
ncbi:MAG: SusC/RagA family TonB-linked outer membrane protein [Gemmatimonadales bacterium]